MLPMKAYKTLQRVKSLSGRLEEELGAIAGSTIEGAKYTRLVEIVFENIPGVEHNTIELSLRPELGRYASRDRIHKLARRLAAAELRLLQHRPVPGWRSLPVAEAVPVLIEDMTPAPSPYAKSKEKGWQVTFRILAGTAVDEQVKRWLSNRAVAAFAFSRVSPDRKTVLGFQFARFRRGKSQLHGYEKPVDLTGLHCMFTIPAHAQNIVLRDLHFDNASVAYNRKVQAFRARTKAEAKCPFEMPETLPCRRCPVGRDRCIAATHARTFTCKECPGCHQKAYFDEKANPIRCISCSAVQEQQLQG